LRPFFNLTRFPSRLSLILLPRHNFFPVYISLLNFLASLRRDSRFLYWVPSLVSFLCLRDHLFPSLAVPSFDAHLTFSLVLFFRFFLVSVGFFCAFMFCVFEVLGNSLPLGCCHSAHSPPCFPIVTFVYQPFPTYFYVVDVLFSLILLNFCCRRGPCAVPPVPISYACDYYVYSLSILSPGCYAPLLLGFSLVQQLFGEF